MPLTILRGRRRREVARRSERRRLFLGEPDGAIDKPYERNEFRLRKTAADRRGMTATTARAVSASGDHVVVGCECAAWTDNATDWTPGIPFSR